jgi:hypothetical protein
VGGLGWSWGFLIDSLSSFEGGWGSCGFLVISVGWRGSLGLVGWAYCSNLAMFGLLARRTTFFSGILSLELFRILGFRLESVSFLLLPFGLDCRDWDLLFWREDFSEFFSLVQKQSLVGLGCLDLLPFFLGKPL